MQINGLATLIEVPCLVFVLRGGGVSLKAPFVASLVLWGETTAAAVKRTGTWKANGKLQLLPVVFRSCIFELLSHDSGIWKYQHLWSAQLVKGDCLHWSERQGLSPKAA